MDDEPKGLPGLKAAREGRQDMTQEKLARAIDVPTRQVQRWEKGEQSPSVWAAIKMAQTLGTSVEALAGIPRPSQEAQRLEGPYGFTFDRAHVFAEPLPPNERLPVIAFKLAEEARGKGHGVMAQLSDAVEAIAIEWEGDRPPVAP